MNLRTWLIVMALVFFTATKTMAAESNPMICFFNGAPIDSGCKAIQRDGSKYVNLDFLNKYLHAVSKWEPDKGNIELQFGKFHFVMNEDSAQYMQDNEAKQLTAAPFKFDEQLWIPMEFVLQLGLIVTRSDQNEIAFEWADNYLVSIQKIKYENRPAFLLIGTKALTVKDSNLILNPDRFILDLSEAKIHPGFYNQPPDNGNVKMVRASQRDTGIRLVFDLVKLTGYKIISDPKQEDQLIIVFNYFIQDVNFFQKEAVRKLQIYSSLPAQYRAFMLQEPNRLVIDMEGATLGNSFPKIAGDGRWVHSIRVAQFDPRTVRVVLELHDEIPCYVARSAEDPHLIEVRTIQTITKVDWSEVKGGQLTITGDGELAEIIQEQRTAERLQIHLNYFKLKPGITAPKIDSKLVTGLSLVQNSPTTVEIDIDLTKHLIYNTTFSKDRHQFIVNLKPSPLLGKTLVLDPGHGGVDPGTCGGQGSREKEITLDVTMRLKNLLEEAGASVVLTRIDDSYINLFERPMIANTVMSALFISIHCNSFAQDPNVRGIEVYYYKDNQERLLANVILEKLLLYTGLYSRGVKVNKYVVLTETQMPSVLVELGYLSNFEEELLLGTEAFREKAAMGLFSGLITYYQN